MRRTASAGEIPKVSLVRRANSSKQAIQYFSEVTETAEAPVAHAEPVVDGTVVAEFPLKKGQAVRVTKAGEWLSELARIKHVHPDGTYDVSVFSNFSTSVGNLREDFVLTKKPYPDEVKEAPPSVANQLAKLESKPPDMFDEYSVDVVREHGGREEWSKIVINGPGLRWDATSRPRILSTMDHVLGTRRMMEKIPGAEESNTRKLKREIEYKTRWDVEAVYCNGRLLQEFHLFRVHGIMEAGAPLVVIGPGQTYDKERWAPIAEPPSRDADCCVLS